MKAILKNLKDQIFTDDKKLMLCKICGAEFSANSGDYFMITDPSYKFKCCNKIMDLVIKKEIYINQ